MKVVAECIENNYLIIYHWFAFFPFLLQYVNIYVCVCVDAFSNIYTEFIIVLVEAM